MFHIVQWEVDKSVTIISSEQVIGEEKIGARVEVKYGRKKYFGSIIKSSEDKSYLETLKVFTDGKVLVSVKGPKKPSEPERIEKSKLSAASKTLTTSRTNVQERRSAALLEIPEAEALFTPDSPRLVEQDSVLRKEQAASDNDLQVDIMDSVATELTDVAPKTTQKTSFAFQFPEPTADNVTYLNRLASYITALYEDKLKKAMKDPNTGEEKMEEAKKELLTMSRSVSRHKVELKPGSQVYAPRELLSDLARDYRHNPKEMIRRLFKRLVGVPALLQMSSLGEGKYRGVPRDIKDAIHYWVNKHTTSDLQLNLVTLNRTINLMCGTLRSENACSQSSNAVSKKERKSGKGKSSSQQVATVVATSPWKAEESSVSQSSVPVTEKEIKSGSNEEVSTVVATSPWKAEGLSQSATAGPPSRVLNFDAAPPHTQPVSSLSVVQNAQQYHPAHGFPAQTNTTQCLPQVMNQYHLPYPPSQQFDYYQHQAYHGYPGYNAESPSLTQL